MVYLGLSTKEPIDRRTRSMYSFKCSLLVARPDVGGLPLRSASEMRPAGQILHLVPRGRRPVRAAGEEESAGPGAQGSRALQVRRGPKGLIFHR